MEPEGMLLSVREQLQKCMGTPVCSMEMIMHDINGFSFIIGPDETFVRLSMANDFDPVQCRRNELWFLDQQQTALERELDRCMETVCEDVAPMTNLSKCLQVEGSYDTWSVTIRRVSVADGALFRTVQEDLSLPATQPSPEPRSRKRARLLVE